MIADRWGLFATPDPSQPRHLIFLHELRAHRFHRSCWCRPRVVEGIVRHQIVTPVLVEQIRREREH